ncbi:hypothetical protein Taro_025312 [Colocasia esculenta]|uniref:Uncharacterized protein n=1 Tax=Colocasia esculenta TaxID=4460 RepID=A0A843VMZ3_COLES|nr:hypothetical protein [Colocasia esculenta]
MSPACALSLPVPGHCTLPSSSPCDPCSSRIVGFPCRPPARVFYRLLRPSMFELSMRTNPHTRARVACAGPDSAGGRGGEEEEEEARGALAELLQECGASREESADIVSNCPKYLEMLVGGVRELDEHSLWGAWENDLAKDGRRDDVCDLSFRKKVHLMAKKKGDKGVLPYLESTGLRYSSSVHIAGYVSFMSLPELIDKMEARRGGLDMLGREDATFPCLVESFPHLLLCSVEKKLLPLIQLLEEVGVLGESVKDVLLLFPSLFSYNIEEDIKPRINKMRKAGGEDKDVGKMLLKYPWILSTSIQENYERVHSFFAMEKVEKQSIDCAIKSWPHILGCSTNRMKVMMEHFGDLGVSSKMLGKIIAGSPQLLLRKPNEFVEVVSFLEEIGLDNESIGRIMCRCPEIFASNVEMTLKKKLDFLMEFGISSKHLPRVVKKYPELLVSDVHSTLLPRISYLMKAGLSKREVGSMVYSFSPLLGYSISVVLKPKLEFLINTMQKTLKDVVEYPRYFSYSLEKKIKPRFWVLKGRNIECSLRDMLGKNDEEFAGDYMGIGRMLIPPSSAGTDDSQAPG